MMIEFGLIELSGPDDRDMVSWIGRSLIEDILRLVPGFEFTSLKYDKGNPFNAWRATQRPEVPVAAE